MPFFFYVLVPAICFLVAIVIGRSWVLLLPVAAWLLLFGGSYFGWWGAVGDGWHIVMLGHIAVGVAAAAVGLAIRWLIVRVSRFRRAPTQTR